MEVKDSECTAKKVRILEGSHASSLPSISGTCKSGAAVGIMVSLPVAENFGPPF